MHFFNRNAQRLCEDLRARILIVMQEHNITQEMLAEALGVHQSTISRWLSYEGDIHFPAALTSLLKSEKLYPVALEIIRFQAEQLELIVHKNVSYKHILDGSLNDEALGIVEHIGKVVSHAREGKTKVRQCRAELEKIKDLVDRALQEIKTMV